MTNFSQAFIAEQKELWRSLKISQAASGSDLETRRSHQDTSDFQGNQDIVDEQRRILAQIQQENCNKASPSVSRRTARAPPPLTSLCASQNGDISSHMVQHVSDHTMQRGARKVNVKGTDHTIQSIASGKAVLAQCSSCYTILQVGETAKHVYCTQCETVTSMEEARGVCTSKAGATDDLISKSLQRQEMSIALRKKTDLLRESPTRELSQARK